MGAINFGIPKDLITKILAAYPINNFVETGTYLGGTTYWASGQFKNVHTIEIAEGIYNSTKEKYKEVKNINFHLGDSKKVLAEIAPKLDGPALFWLDGHWCGRDTGGKDNLCPVLDELHWATQVAGSVILIDDLRCFLGPMPVDTGEEYPPVQEIINYFKEKLPDYYVTFHDDTIVAVPPKLKSVVDEVWKNNYNKRYPYTLSRRISKYWWRLKNLNFKNEYN